MASDIDGYRLLFVYGTLMRGEENHQMLGDARLLREVATGPGFALVDLGSFPGMIKTSGSGVVQGELYRIPESLVPALDRLEDHPNMYWRTRVALADRSEATTYLLADRKLVQEPRIAGGDWRRRA